MTQEHPEYEAPFFRAH